MYNETVVADYAVMALLVKGENWDVTVASWLNASSNQVWWTKNPPLISSKLSKLF